MPMDKSEDLVQRAVELSPKFAARAADYDRNVQFPTEDFDDLHAAGLLSTAVPHKLGGQGIAMSNGDPLTQWRITTAVAKGDLSLGRCYEGHVNAVDMINKHGSEEQQQHYLSGVVNGDMRFVIWGSEPVRKDVSDFNLKIASQTTVERVDGGWKMNGIKGFATSAGAATHALIMALLPDPERELAEQQHIFIVDLNQPGIIIDKDWWKVLGMRATVSHMVTLKDVIVPEDGKLMTVKEYLDFNWQARFIPHFTASFLGASEAAFEFAKDYIAERGKGEDPYVQHHAARMRIGIELMHGYLARTGATWMADRPTEAAVMSNICRVIGQEQAEMVVNEAIRACGASALLEKYPLERIFRDLTTYVQHENIDRILGTIGRASLGLEYDPNWSNPVK